MKESTQKFLLFWTALAFIILFALLLALPTMLLWNWALLPAVDGIHEISFWQALGLNVLFSILFKSHGTTKSNG